MILFRVKFIYRFFLYPVTAEDAADVVLLGRRQVAFLALQAIEARLAEVQDERLADGPGRLQREVVEHAVDAPSDAHLLGGEEVGTAGAVGGQGIGTEGPHADDIRRRMEGGQAAQAMAGLAALGMIAVDKGLGGVAVVEVLVHGRGIKKRGCAEMSQIAHR